jgi:two-component system, cell cycle response regulator CtrA
MRILLVEDDPAVSQSVALMLRSDTCEVQAAPLGQEGIELAYLNGYDIILLDLDLPDLSGYEALRALRAAGIDTPVLILSGLSTVANKVKALEFGADDYLTKPFHKDELLARVHAVIRRADAPAEPAVRCGDLVIYLEAKRAEIAGQPVPLTRKEFEVLELLALRQGMTISKEMFLHQLYGGIDEPALKIIDVFLCKLRKKLSAFSGGAEYIATVWGRGYMLRGEPERLRGAA